MKQTLKNSILSAALMVSAAVASNANAGPLIIDTNGNAAGGTLLNLSGLGSSFGNFLAESALAGNSANLTAGGTTIYAQNAIRINQTGCAQCELTVLFSIPMTAGLVGDTLGLQQSSPGTFRMWFDTSGESFTNNGAETQQIGGTSYTDGVLILEGVVTVVPPLSFSRTNAPSTAALDAPTGGYAGTAVTILGNGSATIDVDLTAVNSGFVVDEANQVSLLRDLQVQNALRLDYTNAANNRASTSFANVSGGPNIIPNFGAGAVIVNDFRCEAAQTCDFIAQMNSTFLFFQTAVPEPGTVALLGAGLCLAGGMRLRRQNKLAA